MTRKTPEETARAADELYAHRDDPDLEGEIVDLKPARSLSTVISVRLNAEELATIEAAASRSGAKLGTFIRRAALAAAGESPGATSRWGEVVVSGAQLAEAVESAVWDFVVSKVPGVPEGAARGMQLVVRGGFGTTGERADDRVTAKGSIRKSPAGRRIGPAKPVRTAKTVNKTAKQAARADQPVRRRSR
jgi:hypothetical protein